MPDTVAAPFDAGASARQYRLYQAGMTVLVVAMAYLFLTAQASDTINRIQGLIMFFLAVWPSLEWLKRRDSQFPLVEVLLLTTATSYALPILNGHEEADGYPLSTIMISGWVVIGFQCCILLGYHGARSSPKKGPFWSDVLLSSDACRMMSYGVVTNTIYLAVSNYTSIIPSNFDGAIRAGCVGIAIVCTFITARMWGAGELKKQEKTFITVNILIQLVLQTETLFLIGAISLIALSVLGYLTSSKRVPLLLCLIAIPMAAILHNGESDMRAEYWTLDGNRRIPDLAALPDFYAQWFGYGLSPKAKSHEHETAAQNLIQRTSLFQMVCLVVDNTPDRVPYISGTTYGDIPRQLVPRFFWPNKPGGQWSTNYLSVYYGLQNEDATADTTIAFGQIAESYANFGFIGVLGLGLLTGAFYKTVQEWTKNTPLLSQAGILLVVLMAWTFQTEYSLSTWISSFAQGVEAIIATLLVITKLL